MSGKTSRMNNFVAKYMKRYNKSAIMKDQKRESKKTGDYLDELYERNDDGNRGSVHKRP